MQLRPTKDDAVIVLVYLVAVAPIIPAVIVFVIMKALIRVLNITDPFLVGGITVLTLVLMAISVYITQWIIDNRLHFGGL